MYACCECDENRVGTNETSSPTCKKFEHKFNQSESHPSGALSTPTLFALVIFADELMIIVIGITGYSLRPHIQSFGRPPTVVCWKICSIIMQKLLVTRRLKSIENSIFVMRIYYNFWLLFLGVDRTNVSRTLFFIR